MPIVVPVNLLESGMVLASNIINKYSVLLPHGRKLTETDIDALKRRFPNYMVQIADPLLDQIVEFDDNSEDYKVSMEVRSTMSNVSKKISQTIRTGAVLKEDNIVGMQRSIEEMIKHMEDNPVTMAVIEQSNDWDDYLQEHCSNVFYLSVVIGNTIRNYIKRERERLSAAKIIKNAMDIGPLATAALLHDIGMVPIEQLIRKAEPLNKNEIQLIKSHPRKGADMLPDKIDPMVRLVIRSHHESHNGSGYPSNLKGDKINIFARIVRVADAYSSAIATTIYKKAKSPISVLHEMLYGDYRHFYDPIVLRVFSKMMQPFPIGAKLKLESGKIAVVAKHNPKNPFKPQVIIAFDEQGNHLSEDKYEAPFFLDEREDIKVMSFGEEDISFINNLQQESSPEEIVEQIIPEYHEMFDLTYP